MREFDTGATRDDEDGKLDYEAYLSPTVLYEFAAYMSEHSELPDGSTRAGDNWQRGIPPEAYMKSLLRHVFDLWLLHRGQVVFRPETGKQVQHFDALGGAFFNLQGYWHDYIQREINRTSLHDAIAEGKEQQWAKNARKMSDSAVHAMREEYP